MNVGDGRLRVLLVSPVQGGGQAWRWLRRSTDFDGQLSSWTDAFNGNAPAPDDFGVVWIDSPVPDLPPALPRALAGRARAGLLLTRGACRLTARLGLGAEPGEQVDTVWRDADDDLHLFSSFTEFPHIRGHCPMRRHPLFAGLGNGTFTWRPAEDEPFVRLTWQWPDWPANADVIAVERSYIHVNAGRATIWSHPRRDAPAVLCIGAYLPFESRDLVFRTRLERLTRNALHVAAGATAADERGLLWRRVAPAAVEDATLPMPKPAAHGGHLPVFEGPALPGTPEDDSPFTLAGRRALVAGGEARGIDEIWMHPLRVLSDLRVDGAVTHAVRIMKAGIERSLRVHGVDVTERIFAAYDDAAAIIEWSAAAPVRLSIDFRSDLRLMWPYPGWCLAPLRWRRDGAALVVHGSGGDDVVTFAWEPVPVEGYIEDASTAENPVVSSRIVVDVDDAAPARLTIAAVVDGETRTSADDLPDAGRLGLERAAAIRRIRDERLAVSCPDPAVTAALDWATWRLDSAIVHTPGVGTGLIAGYWRSSEGWGDGRPGYAWYFGRDSVWTALGALAVGDFEAAALTLRFLGRHQDVGGKILHECTTSGLVHYDAADSTPLYLLLAARYLAWTGDQALIREEWPYIRRAFDFALGTDHDADGLIENTRQGHGWIEFGRLGGGDLTHYNAAIWTAAVGELADVARVAGQPELATRLVALSIRARRALERTFFDGERGGYALNVRRGEEGGWIGEWTQTAMQAVPLLLGVAEPARMEPWLNAVAGDAFTAPWGVRMLPRTDPHYDPKSYHGGAVWPLYTGWVSWAEYAAGRSRAATRHWRMNVAPAFERAKGAWDEVLHGEERRAAGVCPDQAWSTALAVAPLVYGLLGVAPDALRARVRIAPQIPEEWQHLHAERIRVGGARYTLEYARDDRVHRFQLSATDDACRVLFEPALPSPVAEVRVDGDVVYPPCEPFGERQRLRLELALRQPVTVEILT